MRIVEPVIARSLLAEWETTKAGAAVMIERADAAGMLADPALSLSAGAMVLRHRPCRFADDRIKYLFPDTDE